MYYGKHHIWNHDDIRSGNVHFWHKKNSLRYTTILGRFACRVCSKILGIGSAERCWGDVKHLKTDKRAHLSADRVKKQATIYGASCILKAQSSIQFKGQKSKNYLDNDEVFQMLDNDDYKQQYDLFEDKAYKCSKVIKARRTFCNWEEKWEEDAIRNKHPVNEGKLLAKYGNLDWYDYDTKKMIRSKNELTYTKVSRRKGKIEGGYSIITWNEDFVEQDELTHTESVEPWNISEDLRYCIAKWYTKHTNLGIEIINKEKTNIEVDNNDIDDDDSY